MGGMKRILVKTICMAVLTLLLYSCHSNNSVISSWGKRKYMKGYYWNRHGNVKDNKGADKDSARRNKIKAGTVVPENETAGLPDDNQSINEGVKPKHKHHHRNKDSIRKSIAAENVSVPPSIDKKVVPPSESTDDYSIRLLILIVALTGFAMLFTGLITPIAIWGITQDFLLITSVFIIFFALFISVNQKLGISPSRNKINPQSNIGKPALMISCWAAIPTIFLFAVVKTSLVSDLMDVQIATIGMFFAGACVLLSLILGIKALCVHDKHTRRAALAIVIDIILITVSLLFLL